MNGVIRGPGNGICTPWMGNCDWSVENMWRSRAQFTMNTVFLHFATCPGRVNHFGSSKKYQSSPILWYCTEKLMSKVERASSCQLRHDSSSRSASYVHLLWWFFNWSQVGLMVVVCLASNRIFYSKLQEIIFTGMVILVLGLVVAFKTVGALTNSQSSSVPSKPKIELN